MRKNGEVVSNYFGRVMLIVYLMRTCREPKEVIMIMKTS